MNYDIENIENANEEVKTAMGVVTKEEREKISKYLEEVTEVTEINFKEMAVNESSIS